MRDKFETIAKRVNDFVNLNLDWDGVCFSDEELIAEVVKILTEELGTDPK